MSAWPASLSDWGPLRAESKTEWVSQPQYLALHVAQSRCRHIKSNERKQSWELIAYFEVNPADFHGASTICQAVGHKDKRACPHANSSASKRICIQTLRAGDPSPRRTDSVLSWTPVLKPWASLCASRDTAVLALFAHIHILYLLNLYKLLNVHYWRKMLRVTSLFLQLNWKSLSKRWMLRVLHNFGH